MRLKSSHYISALIRAEEASGAFCAILNKGAEDAGAIFIVHLKGALHDLLSPAPQSFFDEEAVTDRLFERRLKGVDGNAVSAAIERELKFDPDCWVVEIDKPGDLVFVSIADADTDGDTGSKPPT